MRYEAMLAETVCMRGHQGDEIDAYLARPLGAGPYPAVVVIHHMPGWTRRPRKLLVNLPTMATLPSRPIFTTVKARILPRRTVPACVRLEVCQTIAPWAI